MNAPVQAASVKRLYVGEAVGVNSPVRIQLNYKTFKKQAISLRLVTSTSEITVGTGFLNARGVLDLCTTRPILAGQVVKVFAGYKQVLSRSAQPTAGAVPSDICVSAGGSTGGKGDPGSPGADGKDGATHKIAIDPTLVVDGQSVTVIPALPSAPAKAELREVCTQADLSGNCVEYTQYLKLTIPGGAPGQTGAAGAKGDKGDPGANGAKGDPGANGAEGKSAYEVAGGDAVWGSYGQWLSSLKGNKGDTGAAGAAGASAFRIAQDNGFSGTVTEWLSSLRGQAGKSAYDLYLEQNPSSTLTMGQWVSSLRGKNAYELAIEADPTIATMSMSEWVQSLHGRDGKDGKTGFEAAAVGAPCPIGNSGNTGTYDVKEIKSNALQTPDGGTTTYVLVCKR